MPTTNPAANFQPYRPQYTPSDASIERRVGSLANPNSKNLPLAKSNRIAVLNLSAAVRTTPSGPRRLIQSGLGLSPGVISGFGCAAFMGCAQRPQIRAAAGTGAPQAEQ